MNNKDLLRPMFSYSLLPIIILIIGIGTLLFFLLKSKKEKEKTPIIIKPPTKNLFEIKNRYLAVINILENDIKNNKITKRKAYQRLSIIIRNFTYEVTQIKVQNYSLQEIKKLGITTLSLLVEEYYHPEFAKESMAEINNSINKTREVINKWK